MMEEHLQIDRSDLARLTKMSQAIHAYLGMGGIQSGKEAASLSVAGQPQNVMASSDKSTSSYSNGSSPE